MRPEKASKTDLRGYRLAGKLGTSPTPLSEGLPAHDNDFGNPW